MNLKIWWNLLNVILMVSWECLPSGSYLSVCVCELSFLNMYLYFLSLLICESVSCTENIRNYLALSKSNANIFDQHSSLNTCIKSEGGAELVVNVCSR